MSLSFAHINAARKTSILLSVLFSSATSAQGLAAEKEEAINYQNCELRDWIYGYAIAAHPELTFQDLKDQEAVNKVWDKFTKSMSILSQREISDPGQHPRIDEEKLASACSNMEPEEFEALGYAQILLITIFEDMYGAGQE